jgi:hypothetical protein
MKRRTFLGRTLLALMLAVGCWTVAADSKVTHLINSRNQSSTILIPGFTNHLNLPHMHVASFSFTRNICEYVGSACFEGASFVVEVKPAPAVITQASQ